MAPDPSLRIAHTIGHMKPANGSRSGFCEMIAGTGGWGNVEK